MNLATFAQGERLRTRLARVLDLGEEGACERVPGPRSRNNDSIKAEAAPIAVDRKDQLQHEQEKNMSTAIPPRHYRGRARD